MLTQIVLVGGRVIGRAFAEAYKQAQASAKYAKAAQEGTVSGTGVSARGSIPLDEAYKVLNLKPDPAGPTMEAIAERYKLLFERNDPKKGGSFYLQSKVYRARERLEKEAKRAVEKAEAAAPEQ